jgi:hypothetical protein
MRPRAAVREELHRVLTGALSIPVVVQRQPKGVEAPLVLIESPDTPKRGDLKRDTGHTLDPQRIRVHTRYPKGKANLSRRSEIAETVIGALAGATLDPTDHRIVHWPEEPHDDVAQEYDIGSGEQAYDLLLEYNIHTQIKATI